MAKRRANGEGNICKRKDGRCEGRYTAGYDPDTGKQIIKNVLDKVQAEVKEQPQIAPQKAKSLNLSIAKIRIPSSKEDARISEPSPENAAADRICSFYFHQDVVY